MDDDFAALFLPDILQDKRLSNLQNALDDEEQFNFLETPNDMFSPLIARPFSHYTNLVPVEARTPQVFPTMFLDASRNNSDIPDLPQLNESQQSCDLLNLQCQSTGVELLSKSGSRVANVAFTGFLDGKFFCSDDEADRVMEKKPIACYRRNFITVNCSLNWDPTIDKIMYFGQPHKIDRLRLSLAAATSFSDDILEMLVIDDKKGNSEFNHLTTSCSDFRPLKSQKFQFKKTQFKKATPNNGKSTLRNYFFVVVTLEAVLHSGNSVALFRLKSNPIVVRGRNPSFFTGRNEMVVSRREYEPPSQTESKAASQEPEEDEESDEDSESDYHYIPIKPVYSMPPVDVSYFPHSVHNAKPRVLLEEKQGQSGYKYFLK